MAAKGSWLRQLQRLLERPSFDATEQWCNIAIKSILNQYGDKVSMDAKRKPLLKFGMNTGIGQDEESNIAQLPGSVSRVEIPDSNIVDSLVCTDLTFSGDIYIEGHKIVDGKLEFVTQVVTANGQIRVPLDTPLMIPTRAECADETLFTSLDDLIYIYQDGAIINGVPSDALVHLIFSAEHRQSLRAGTAFSYTDYGIITHIYGDLNKSGNPPATADIILKVRQIGEGLGRIPGGFKTKLIRSVSSSATNSFDFEPRPFIVIPKNSIVFLNVVSSGNNVSLSAGFNTILAGVTE